MQGAEEGRLNRMGQCAARPPARRAYAPEGGAIEGNAADDALTVDQRQIDCFLFIFIYGTCLMGHRLMTSPSIEPSEHRAWDIGSEDRRRLVQTPEYPPASPERLAMAGRSNSRIRNRRMMKYLLRYSKLLVRYSAVQRAGSSD